MKKIIFILFITHCSLQIAVAQPTQEWVRRFSFNNFSNGISVKMDTLGNIYVLMRVGTDTTAEDFGLIKYDQFGNTIWNVRYNSQGNVTDIAKDFVVTRIGDVYITGYSGINFDYHIITIKYSSNGILQWSKIYNGGSSDDSPEDIGIDKQGNIIVAGSTFDGNYGHGLLIKYNPNGDTLFVKKYIQSPKYTSINEIVIDDTSNIYTIGNLRKEDLTLDFLILKYNGNGILQWNTIYDSQQYYNDIGWHITVDLSGNIYVVGSTAIPSSANNNTLIRLNNAGTILWQRTFTGVISGNGKCNYPAGIVTVPNGSGVCYTTSCLNGTGGSGSDIVTLNYNESGDTNWIRRFSGGLTAGTVNSPSVLKIDKYNCIYIGGRANYSSTGDDYALLKYSQNGSMQWSAIYNGFNNYSDVSNDIIIDSASVFITGRSRNITNNTTDAVTIKYSQPIGINPNYSESPDHFILYQNYPNPFNSNTTITYSIAESSMINLKIYNTLGGLVKNLVNENQNTGVYSISTNFNELASGIYFYSLFQNNILVETKKFILVK